MAQEPTEISVHFSTFHSLFVATQYIHGYIFTGRGDTEADAIRHLINAINTYGTDN